MYFRLFSLCMLIGWLGLALEGQALAQGAPKDDDKAASDDAPATDSTAKEGESPSGGGKEGEAGKEENPDVTVERGAGGKKVYRINTSFVIEGRIQKPNAFYVLERSQINYDWAALKQNFLPRIQESLSKSPF